MGAIIRRGAKPSAEGSRGGKVIGHTTSGKPIYSKFGHESHAGFTPSDHKEASELHRTLMVAASTTSKENLHSAGLRDHRKAASKTDAGNGE